MRDVLLALAEINLAAGAAVAFVLLIRRAAQRVMGPRAVYLLWAIVPAAMLATFIPSRTVEALEPIFPDTVIVTAIIPQPLWVTITFSVLIIGWLVGAAVLAAVLTLRQSLFDREAKRGAAGPAVVGFHYPRVVTPDDFAERFSLDERRLILEHEQIHLEHNDSRINAVAALVRCLCWFNPLVHMGARALRIDQELACDAEVISRRPNGRRAYAETLLKTELTMHPLPVGCHWPPEGQHPLKERIAMLARTPLSRRRHLVASVVVLMLAASGGVAAWAAQPLRTVLRETIDVYVPLYPIARHSLQPEGSPMTDTEPAPTR